MRRSQIFLAAAAFALLALFILLQTLNSAAQLARLNGDLRTVVQNHDLRISLITRTQVAAHLRTDTLLRMALTRDPFERDALLAQFDHAGYLVGAGRRRLADMGFDAREQANFQTQDELVKRIQDTQDEITDLLAAGQDTRARAMILREAIPLAAQFNASLAQLRDYYEAANRTALAHAEKTYRTTLHRIFALGIAALVLAGLIGWFSLRKLVQSYRSIETHLEELERSRAALREEATHDALTALANRRLFYDRLQQAVLRARRHVGRLAVLYVDLDRFKEINDQYGHDVGDAVLSEVARRLQSSVRESDTVARIGGDEFTVLLEEVADRAAVSAAMHKISLSLAQDTDFYGLPITIEASIGHALFPEDGTTADALLRAADQSMYRAKHRATPPQQSSLFPL